MAFGVVHLEEPRPQNQHLAAGLARRLHQSQHIAPADAPSLFDHRPELIAVAVCLGVLLPRSLREDGERGCRLTAAHRLGVLGVIAAGAERAVIGRLLVDRAVGIAHLCRAEGASSADGSS